MVLQPSAVQKNLTLLLQVMQQHTNISSATPANQERQSLPMMEIDPFTDEDSTKFRIFLKSFEEHVEV